MRTSLVVLPAAALSIVLAGCGSGSNTEAMDTNTTAPPEACSFDKTVKGVTAVQQADSAPELVIAKGAKPPKKLRVIDLCPGIGVEATPADTVTVDYVGVGYKTRQVFDSSFQRGEPATFPLSGVIPGWTEGVSGMRPGSARLLLIPSQLAYGSAGSPPAIKPNEALAFLVELDGIAGASPAASPS